MTKYKRGDRVRVINKSIAMSKEESPTYRDAQRLGYAYIRGVGSRYGGKQIYKVTTEMRKDGSFGSYGEFLESDLEPYNMDENEAFALLLQGNITESEYESLTRKHT